MDHELLGVTMKAVLVHSYGSPSGFGLEDVAQVIPRPGYVRLKIGACGVSFLDALVAEGRYQVKPPLPFSPGSEFSGVVDAVGDGVDGLRVGDRVCASAVFGGYAEYVCVPAAAVHRIPDEMSFEEAAVFLVPFSTACHALVQRAALRSGETLFVLGAGGSVGLAAVQVGHMLGATVIASGSTAAKRNMAMEAGADRCIDTSSPGWRAELQQAVGKKGIDVVFDPVGGPASELAFRCLTWNGRHLVVGFASGSIASLPLNLPLVKGASVVGVDLRTFNEREPNLARHNFSQLIDGYLRGTLRANVTQVMRLDSFADAMAKAGSGESNGRVVLKP